MTPPITSLPVTIRERIAMVRVLCIGFMIYVHVPDNAISAVSSAGVPLSSWLVQGFVVEGAGRASAALLSLVSGLLTAVALSRGEAAPLYRRRFRSIIVPMLLWSSLTVALYASLTMVRPTFLSLDGRGPLEAVLYYVNTVFFLTAQPMGPTLHLGFLRDLFVCVLLAPFLLAALRRFGALVPLAFGVLYLLDLESVIVLRPLVLFAFSVGLWLAVRGARLEALDASWPVWLVLSVLATVAVMFSGTERGLGSGVALWFGEHGFDFRESVVYPVSRLFGALAIWTLAAKLVGTAWNARLARLSSYVFVAYCSHFLALTFLWEGVVRRLVGTSDAAGYVVWFAVAPFVAMASAALIVEVTARVTPGLASLITGGRVPVMTAPAPGTVIASNRTASGPVSGMGGASGERRAIPVPARRGDSPVGLRERHANTPERAEVGLEPVAADDR